MITLREATNAYLDELVMQGHLAPMTERGYRSNLRHLVRVLGDVPIDSLSEDNMIEWHGSIRFLAASTRCTHFSVVAGFCDWLRRRGHTRGDLLDEFRRPSRPQHESRYLAIDRVSELLEGCPDARARAIVMVMVGMGLRCCEVAGLELGDWDQHAKVMLVRIGKGGHQRSVPVPAAVRSALHAYLNEHPIGATAGPLFRGYLPPKRRQPVSSRQAISPNHMSVLVSTWMDAAGLKARPRDGVSAHALRHTAASDVLDRCNDLRVVQEMLGHRHLSTTARYLRRAGLGKMREAMEGRSYRTAS